MSDTRYWSKEFTTTFLEKYHEFPCLWKIKSKEYLNKNLKTSAYDELVELCRQIQPDANRDFVVKKIQGFRGSFRKELKKVMSSKRSGKGHDQVYEPTLWYYNLLLFTIDQETPSASLCNISESFPEVTNLDQNNENDVPELEDGSTNLEKVDDQPSTSKFFPVSQPQKVNTNKKKRTVDEFMMACTQALSKNTEIDEYDAVGINVTNKLKKMDNKQSIYADLLINKILCKGLLGTLTPATDIYEPVGTIRNDEIYLSHLQNTTPDTAMTQINYDSQNLTQHLMHPPPLNYSSMNSISSASPYDYSHPTTSVGDLDSSLNSS